MRRCLKGSNRSDVLYDAERSLGEFLFDHEKQLDKDWNAEAIYPLKNALVSVLDRREHEASALEFLDEKEKNRDPICVFTSYQCRRWHVDNLTMLGDGRKSNQFECQIMGLTRSFKQIIWGEEKNYSADHVMKRIENPCFA